MKGLRQLGALARQDLLMWRRMPVVCASALIPPIAMALLVVVLSLTVTKQPVALVVQSHGPISERMADLIRSDEDAYALQETDAGHARRLLETQQVAAIFTIPPNFGSLADSSAAKLGLTLNNIDLDFSDDIRRSVERSTGRFNGLDTVNDASDGSAGNQADNAPDSTDSADSKTEDDAAAAKDDPTADAQVAAAAMPVDNAYHIRIDEHDLRKTSVDFLHYQVLPVLILLALSVGLLGTAMMCSFDNERGTARVLILAPVPARILVTGRMVGGLLVSVFISAAAVAVCLAFHAMTVPEGHWPCLLCLMFCTSACAAGLGALVGTGVKGQRNAAMAASIAATYLFFLGGGFTTIAFLPGWLQTFSAFNPIRYSIDGLRQLLFYPEYTGVLHDLLVLAGSAICAVAAGSTVVARSWQD